MLWSYIAIQKLYCDKGCSWAGNCIAGNSKLGIVLQESVLQYTGLYYREESSVVLQDCIARD